MAAQTPSQIGSQPFDARGGMLGDLLSVRHDYVDLLDRQRAVAVAIMSQVFGGLGLAGILLLAFVFRGVMPGSMVVPNIVLSLLYLVANALVQNGRLRLGSVVFVLLTLIVPAVQAIPFDFLGLGAMAISFTVPIVSGAFLFGPVWAFALLAGSWVMVGILVYQQYNAALILSAEEARIAISSLTVTTTQHVFILLMIGVLSWLLTSSLFNWAFNAQRRARQLEATVVVSETAASAPNLSTLLNEVVDRIREAYGFYHAQVFLLDEEGRNARLEASTGRAGEALLGRGHSLPVGSQSVVGQATATGEPMVVNNTVFSRIHRPNELLPDTRAELALPLLVDERVIGAIDVQSTIENVFQPDDVRSLQVLAAQLASAVDKARLVDQLQIRAQENERLYEDAQRSLRQIEDLNRRLTREGWTDYLRARRLGGTMGYTLQGDNVRGERDWTAPMKQAYQGESSVVIRSDNQAHIVALPVRVRGEVIGVLEVERDGERPWNESELEMVETLVERLALAVENARLYEQATEAVEREQLVNRIAQDVQEASSIDEVLQSALSELSEVLGASRGVVQIKPKAKPAPDAGGPSPDNGA